MSGSHGFLRRALAAFVCLVSVAAGFALVFRSSASDVLPSVSTPQLLGLLALMILPGVVLMASRADRSAQQSAASRAGVATDVSDASIPMDTDGAELAAPENMARALTLDARAHAPARPGEDAADRHRRRSRSGSPATRSVA
ncbi:MAG: hypothetical protein K2W85_16520 [Phycisphaerales bacterium]|nr:hypothetical protein [Phycisphaerales bacterium]